MSRTVAAPLDGKRALVTGSAQGIGRAIAVGLAEQGAAHVVLVDRNAAAVTETAAAVRAAGAEATVSVVDLRDGSEERWDDSCASQSDSFSFLSCAAGQKGLLGLVDVAESQVYLLAELACGAVR